MALLFTVLGFISIFIEDFEWEYSLLIIFYGLVFTLFANYTTRNTRTAGYTLKDDMLLFSAYTKKIMIPFKVIYNLKRAKSSIYITFIYLDKNDVAKLKRIRINGNLIDFKELYDVLNKECRE